MYTPANDEPMTTGIMTVQARQSSDTMPNTSRNGVYNARSCNPTAAA